MIDLSFDILTWCIVPYLSDIEKRTLSATCKKMREAVGRYCLADKTSIRDLCRRGELLVIYKRKIIVNSSFQFRFICEKGFINLFKQSILASNFNKDFVKASLEGSCCGGHRKIIDFLDSRNQTIDWNDGLCAACQGGHQEIVDLMIARGATTCRWCNETINYHL